MTTSGCHTMPFGWIGHTALNAAARGCSIAPALGAAGVGGDRGLDETTPLGPAEFLLSCALLINAVDDEMHGAADCPMVCGTASIAARAMVSATSLAGAIETLSRALGLMTQACSVRLRTTSCDAIVEIHAEVVEGKTKTILEELMAHFVLQQISLFVGFALQPGTFITTATDHPTLDERHPFMLCPVRRGNVTALRFSRTLLALPSAVHIVDGPLWDAQSFWLAHHPATAPPGIDRVRSPVSAAVFNRLIESDCRLDACVAGLAATPEALQRALLLEGWNYRRLRRAALLERARPHVSMGASSEDLAIALGYSDQRSFRRALKLATGMSVRELRASNQPNAGPERIVTHLRRAAAMRN